MDDGRVEGIKNRGKMLVRSRTHARAAVLLGC